MPAESPPRNTRGAFRPTWGAWGVSALVAIAAWAVGCGEPQPPIAMGRIPALTVEVGNTESVDPAGYFSDPDGDSLIYTATSSDPGVATVAVSGATVQVTAVAAGNATVTVTASDPGGLSADQTFAVTVPNRPPVAVGRIPDAETFVGESVEIALAGYFDDPDGDALTYAAASSNEGAVTVAVAGDALRVEGVGRTRPRGTVTVTITASDAGELSATQTFAVAVHTAPAYLVQAVQSWHYPVPVVAAKEALLRVFVRAIRATTETLPPAKATFYVDGSETYSVEIDGTSGAIPTEVDEGSLAKSLNVTIPDSVIEEGLSVVIDIDPDSTIDAGILASKRIPKSGELDLGVEGVPGFELTVIPFLYTQGPDSSVLDHVDGMESEEEEHRLLHDTYDLLPIEEMSVEGHDPVEIDTNSVFSVLNRTRAIRAAESGSGYWMGLIAGSAGGVAELPGTSSASTPDAWVMAHELGHNLNLWHAPCGVRGDDPGYPYPDGSIGAWGYDHRSGSLIDKDQAKDLMTYCRPVWVSDYHFEKAVRYRTEQAMMRGEPSDRSGPSLLVWGSRSASGELSMDPALVVEGRSLLPEAQGDYTLTGLDGAGREHFSVSFDMAELADAEEGTGMFVFLMPVEPGWEELASIALAGPGDAVFTLDGDTEATMAWIRDMRSGQVRAIRGDLDERPSVPPGHVVRWSRGIPDRDAWRLR